MKKYIVFYTDMYDKNNIIWKANTKYKILEINTFDNLYKCECEVISNENYSYIEIDSNAPYIDTNGEFAQKNIFYTIEM